MQGGTKLKIVYFGLQSKTSFCVCALTLLTVAVPLLFSALESSRSPICFAAKQKEARYGRKELHVKETPSQAEKKH